MPVLLLSGGISQVTRRTRQHISATVMIIAALPNLKTALRAAFAHYPAELTGIRTRLDEDLTNAP